MRVAIITRYWGYRVRVIEALWGTLFWFLFSAGLTSDGRFWQEYWEDAECRSIS
jgi:hypothetical protein